MVEGVEASTGAEAPTGEGAIHLRATLQLQEVALQPTTALRTQAAIGETTAGGAQPATGEGGGTRYHHPPTECLNELHELELIH